MVGPVVKVSESDLPRRANIHYLGSKNYLELPSYFSGWDAGMLPFALNDSTRFISPTKTPEYLAAGLPVVSTPITDVVKPYGDLGLVSIARSAEECVSLTQELLSRDPAREPERLRRVDAFLARTSWDKTYVQMRDLISQTASERDLTLKVENSIEGVAAD